MAEKVTARLAESDSYHTLRDWDHLLFLRLTYDNGRLYLYCA